MIEYIVENVNIIVEEVKELGLRWIFGSNE